MRLRMIFALLVLYGVFAGFEYDPAGWRLILQPATRDAAEVYWQPVDDLDVSSPEGLEPYNRALIAAEDRAAAHPRDLAPPYLLYDTRTLVVPYVTELGRELAGARMAADVPQVRRQVAHSQAELKAVVENRADRPINEEHVMAMGIRAELNRVNVLSNTLDQGLRRRIAAKWGDLVVIEWNPFAQPLSNLM
ncbi:hypothetical protein [Nonomuraea insulae]|uniref:Uncharacterized protein n=1 Tax=Nonomuraea insulae TaxID=1616787 RepID=A0ABW1CU98_9ACTN